MVDIAQWIKDRIEGPGGMDDFERYEWVVWHQPERVAAADWIIRCLANPSCKGSAEVLEAIQRRRESVIVKERMKLEAWNKGEAIKVGSKP